VNRRYPEGIRLLLRVSTEQVTLADRRKNVRERKAPKGETKRAPAPGSQLALARPRRFQNAGDVKNAPLVREQKAT
jgi:hypothetical protein